MNDDSPAPFLAHIERCQTARLPGTRLPIFVGNAQIGWVAPQLFTALTDLGYREASRFLLPDSTHLEQLGERLAALGLYRSHNERFDVFDTEQRIVGQIDRGALPLLGCSAAGVHLNGLVEKPEGLFLWMGRRAHNKRLDPGKLDHLVAGGISAGLKPTEALIKEAGEEANIEPDLAKHAVPVATIRYAMERPEGLRRDTLFCYDLILPEDFTPCPVDGEVASFELMPLKQVYRIVRDTQEIKFNVTLVLIDLFLRLSLFSAQSAQILSRALYRD